MHGRGGKRGAKSGGPRLPFKLTKEIFGDQGGSLYNHRPKLGPRKERRRERDTKLQEKHINNRNEKNHSPNSEKTRKRMPAEELHPKAKRTKEHQQPGSNTYQISELLPTKVSLDREKALQKDLARKLGLKKGKKMALGDDDGMDELMDDLGGLDDVFSESDDDRGHQTADGVMIAGLSKRKRYAKETNEENESPEEQEFSESDDMKGLLESGSDLPEKAAYDNNGNERTLEAPSLEKDANPGVSSPPPSRRETKYVPPAVRRAREDAAGLKTAQDTDYERILRRVRGLLNRLADSNMAGIVGELSELYENEGRSFVSGAVAAELVSAAAHGPRASERFSAVAAAAVSGLAGMARASDVIASFLAQLASSLEASLSEPTADSLATGNLIQVISHLLLSGAIKADIVYSLLDKLCVRFSEADVAAIAGLMRLSGLALRTADPERMKDFVVSVHARAAEQGGPEKLSARTRVMLDTVLDVKNNRKRADGKGQIVTLDGPAARWLRGTGVSSIAVGGISWEAIVSGDKRGRWWLPTATTTRHPGDASNRDTPAALADNGVIDTGHTSAPELLKLASKLRMTTDVRRAVFCAVMGSEDSVDAVEKLLRLGLKGDQEREIVRVTVECCLHEASYNPYYAHVLTRLCVVGKSHKITLQYCFWDHWKELNDMDLRRLATLAKLGGVTMANFSLPSMALKVVEFDGSLRPRQVLFWRLFFEALLEGFKKDDDMTTAFQRMAAPDSQELRKGLKRFLRRDLGPWLAQKNPGDDTTGGGAPRLAKLLKRCQLAERLLSGQ